MKKNNITKNIETSIDNMIEQDYIFSLTSFIFFAIPRLYFVHEYLDFIYFQSQLIIYLFISTFFLYFITNYKISRTMFFLSVLFTISSYVINLGGVYEVPSSWFVMAIFLFFYYLRSFAQGIFWSTIFIITLIVSHYHSVDINLNEYPQMIYLQYYDILFSFIFMTYFSFQIRQRFKFLFEKFQKIFKLQNILSSIFHHDLANSFTGLQLNLRLNNDDEVYDGINQIIDLSKNASKIGSSLNQEDAKISRFELLESTNSVIYKYEHLTRSKGISIEVNSFQEQVYILGDQALFSTSILSNLLSNAIKFSHDNSKIIITIKEDDLGDIHYSLADSGIGIPKKMLKDLFDINSSSSRIGTQNEAGNGFGLVIVKSILESWNATIKVSSIDNIGTTFLIRFRRAGD